MKKANQKGFTLIELLVVIAIIGILSAVVLVSLNSARQRSRDARRLSDVRQMQTALELYFNDQGSYPTGTALVIDGEGLGSTGWVATPVAPIYLQRTQAAPAADAPCVAGAGNNDYTYTQVSATAYTLTTCLSSPTGGYTDGTADADVTIDIIASEAGIRAE